MSPLLRRRTSATDGDWMDLPDASMYAGVTLAALTTAVQNGELVSRLALTRRPSRLVHSHSVEAWAAERESRLVALVG